MHKLLPNSANAGNGLLANVIGRFFMKATLAAPKDLFNDSPQGLGLEMHHKSAYIFVPNVVPKN
ncbi:MAG: hypothetical protein DRR08_21445 [Candidatus Parabeggiatoa sp. nov. 2]|nr:MAG: hypothetical protein DRR08_21445 [Gammaproteobacteria bacterium]